MINLSLPSNFSTTIKNVSTIGPASSSIPVLENLIDAGLSVARLNFSHGTHSSHAAVIAAIRAAAQAKNCAIPLMLDTKGPEIRTGLLPAPVALAAGQSFFLSTDSRLVGSKDGVSVSFAGLPQALAKNDLVFLDDGLIRLRVEKVEADRVVTTVLNAGELGEHKGVNVPGKELDLPVLTEQDEADLKFGVSHDVDFVAASFVQRAEDLEKIRSVLENGKIKIFSKIECAAGVKNFDAILENSDGIMIARGDLGIETPVAEVIKLQKIFAKKCLEKKKPFIVATQMLQSMTKNPSPTRAEVADVHNAVLDGTDAVMLSGESANGKYPVESVRFQMEICRVAKEDKDKEIELKLTCEDENKYEKIVNLVKEKERKVLVFSKNKKLLAWLCLVKNVFCVLGDGKGEKDLVTV